MTIEEKKEFLNQYRRLDDAIKWELEELAKWKALAYKITPAYGSRCPGKGESNRIQEAYERVEALNQQITVDVERMVEFREMIIWCIEQLDEYSLRTLLKYHYINQLSLEEVADKMSYCYRQITRLHRRALQLLQISPEAYELYQNMKQ